MAKIILLMNEAGEAIAGSIRFEIEPESDTEDHPSMAGILSEEGQEVIELEIPDDDVPAEPPSDFLEQTLRRYRDSAS